MNGDLQRTMLWMVISLLGMSIHNRFEFPEMPLTNPEYVYPSIYSLVLFLGLWRQPAYQKVWEWLILIWGLLHFVGGAVLSVLPLAILPFNPEQSISHYTSHVMYGLAQLPLLLFLGSRLIRKINGGERPFKANNPQ